MKETFKKGAQSFKDLAHFQNFTRTEMLLKSLILILFLPLQAIIFLLVCVFYTFERLFAFGFRFFIGLQARSFKRRATVARNLQKFFTLLSVILFIVFLPVILVYYLSMLFKYIGKQLIKKLVFVVDFSDHINKEEYRIFDDMSVRPGTMQMSGMMKDLSDTAAIGSAFEHIVNEGRHNTNNRDDIDKQ